MVSLTYSSQSAGSAGASGLRSWRSSGGPSRRTHRLLHGAEFDAHDEAGGFGVSLDVAAHAFKRAALFGWEGFETVLVEVAPADGRP